MASTLFPEAPEECALRCFSRRFRISQRKLQSMGGVRSRECAESETQLRNPPIRNPLNPWILARESP
eukprot:9099527-Alexandrium_andersonii.AAC.1